MALALILTNIPRPPLRPILVHPRLVLENNKPPPDIIVAPLQPRPPLLPAARQPAAQHEAQYNANGHSNEESAEDLVSAVAI
ncbi:hypothetical protein N5P37_011321 [Trichoderma harzianum]|nr:hypothetical protein N5P37_011321 [Trichoderma harzianum]